MFEPENDIERMLLRAGADPAERSGFLRALMDAEVFVVLVAKADQIVQDADGTIPKDTRLRMPAVVRGEERLIPFFTAASRARAWFKDDHVVAPEWTRGLFTRHPDQAWILNPGSDYGKEFTRSEVKGLLAGDFGEQRTRNITVPPGEQFLLWYPSEYPHTLIAALGHALGAVESVRGAWLMLAMRDGESEQTWMLGIDHHGSWDEIVAAIDRALAGNVLKGRPLDSVPLNDSPLSSKLRTGIPVTAAKAGLQ